MDLPLQPNLYIYSRFKDRLHPDAKQIPFYLIGSGSDGNSVYLKDLHTIIDLGFPYKRYAELDPNFFLYVDYIFLTHEHSDHLNPATMMKILKMFPHITFSMTPSMAKTITNADFKHLTDEQKAALTGVYSHRFIVGDRPATLSTRNGLKFTYQPHLTEHGPISNVAIQLTCDDKNIHFMYASDLDTLGPGTHSQTPGLPQGIDDKFNLLLLEANYDADVVKKVIEDAKVKMETAKAIGADEDAHYYYNQQFRAQENLRHISEQASWEYVGKHLTNDGWFIPLHASRTFGTLVQKKD